MKVLEVIQQDQAVVDFLLPRMRVAREMGIETAVWCWPGEYVPIIRQAGFRVHLSAFDRGLSLRTLRAIVQLAKVIRLERPDIVHTHFTTPGFIGRVASRLVPKHRVICHQVHGFYFRHLQGLKRYLYILLETVLARCCTDYLLFQNQDDLKLAAQAFRVDPRRLVYLGNGIDVARYRVDERLPGRTVRIMAAGRLEQVKDFPTLLRALRHLRESGIDQWRCEIYGEGVERPVLEDTTRQMGLAHLVEFKGRKPNLADAYRTADVFVLTSLMEGKPRVVMEAMAAGLPVVATDVPGTRELVRHGVTGFLVPVGDDKAVASALEKLVASRELRMACGASGTRVACEEFDEAMVARRLAGLFREIAS